MGGLRHVTGTPGPCRRPRRRLDRRLARRRCYGVIGALVGARAPAQDRPRPGRRRRALRVGVLGDGVAAARVRRVRRGARADRLDPARHRADLRLPVQRRQLRADRGERRLDLPAPVRRDGPRRPRGRSRRSRTTTVARARQSWLDGEIEAWTSARTPAERARRDGARRGAGVAHLLGPRHRGRPAIRGARDDPRVRAAGGGIAQGARRRAETVRHAGRVHAAAARGSASTRARCCASWATATTRSPRSTRAASSRSRRRSAGRPARRRRSPSGAIRLDVRTVTRRRATIALPTTPRAGPGQPAPDAPSNLADTPMTDADLNSLLTIALTAAFADGAKHDAERIRMRELAARLAGDRIDLAELDRKVLLDKPPLAEIVRPLSTPDCAGTRTSWRWRSSTPTASQRSGRLFLRDLALALGVPAEAAAKVVADADAIAAAPRRRRTRPRPRARRRGKVVPDAAALDQRSSTRRSPTRRSRSCPSRSRRWRSCRCRCGWSTGSARPMATSSTRAHQGIPRDARRGLTGQYLEQFGRKLLGGLLGSVLGGMGRAAGHQAASSGMSFATTWALGQLAKQYYGGGRTLDAAKLKSAFAPLARAGPVARAALRRPDRRAGQDDRRPQPARPHRQALKRPGRARNEP